MLVWKIKYTTNNKKDKQMSYQSFVFYMINIFKDGDSSNILNVNV